MIRMPHHSIPREIKYSFEGKRALIITTSHGSLDKVDPQTGKTVKKGKPTGVHASELTEAYDFFTSANLQVDIASVKGGEIPVDPFSMLPLVRTSYDKKWLNNIEFQKKIKSSISIKDVDVSVYDYIFIAGGWGAAYDLGQSDVLGEKITEANAQKKIIGTVCHGCLGLAKALKEDGSPLVKNVNVTGVSNRQLKEVMKSGTPLHPETEMKRLGARYTNETGIIETFKSLVVVDVQNRLVTGQNQKSTIDTVYLMFDLAEGELDQLMT